VKTRDSRLLERLRGHNISLESHLKNASDFLVGCQIIAPYVQKGTLHGCVCPWEIGETTDEGAYPIVEDFHDTLEAIWVWSMFTKVSGDQSFKLNADLAWKYIINNWNRFIGEKGKDKGLYDCSYVLFSGPLVQSIFDGNVMNHILKAGNRLAEYLKGLQSTDGREYYDPFWMAYCLERAARKLNQKPWSSIAEAFVNRTVVEKETPFTRIEKEPSHKGPGGHDFFSKNANMALALTSCFGREKGAEQILLTEFLQRIPNGFVHRHVDENAWNAHLATALGKSYVLTGNQEFLSRYFAVMDELARRDLGAHAALPRSPSFGRRESWVTFFYSHAYTSIIKILADVGSNHAQIEPKRDKVSS